MKRILWGLFCWIVTVTIVNAASFDCGKASTKVEKLICGDTELSKLDEDLSKAYQQSLERGDVKKGATVSQRQWLKNKRNVCQNSECIKAAYENRIKELGFTSSFGIVFMMPSGSSSSPPQTTAKVSEPQVAAPPVKTQKTQAVQQQMQTSVADCGTSTISDVTNLPKSKAVTQLIEISKAQFEKLQFECAVQSLEQANIVVRLAANGAERAAMGFEIKDVALGVIQHNKIADRILERRLVLAATQSIDSNGKLTKNASEDERFNDVAFLGAVSDHYNRENRKVEYRQIDLTMLCLNFSLPPGRRWADKWRLTNFLADQNRKGYLSEIVELMEYAQSDVLPSFRSEFVDSLKKVAGGRMVFYHELLPVDDAKNDINALSRLLPMLKDEVWGFQMYLYLAEANWQLGEKNKARESFNKARDIVQGGQDIFWLAKFLCGKSRSCPFGIYSSSEMTMLLDEVEKLAATNSYIKNNLDKIQWMRRSVAQGTSQ